MLPLLDLWSELQKTIWDTNVASGFFFSYQWLSFFVDCTSPLFCAFTALFLNREVCLSQSALLEIEAPIKICSAFLASIMISCVSLSSFERFCLDLVAQLVRTLAFAI